jgi:glycerophosphoryl diester phosphodiesterase
MVVAPNGEVLGNLHSRAGVLAVSFDPKSKFLKPAGFGNPPATHAEYVEAGRRPWRYRPAGSAIIPPFAQMPAKRLCAHRGFSTIAPENGMAALGAAVGLSASEIEFDLWWTKDGEIVSIHDPTLDRVSDGSGKIWEHTLAQLQALDFGAKKGAHFKGTRIVRFEDILAKFSQHVIMNIHVKDLASDARVGSGEWDESLLRKVIGLIDDYDARRHVYFMATADALQRQLARLAPDIPRCQGEGFWKDGSGDIVDHALANGCSMVQLFKPNFGQATIDRAKAAGLHCNVFWSDDPEEARQFLDMGIDTILTNDYQPIAAATELK